MESSNSLEMNNKVSQLMDKINDTCNSLISALDVNAQSIGIYGGSVVQQINSEYVDILIKDLLKIKYHLFRLRKELNSGLISSKEELECIISGLLNIIDTMNNVCLKDGYLKNNFSFATDELKNMTLEILSEINVNVAA